MKKTQKITAKLLVGIMFSALVLSGCGGSSSLMDNVASISGTSGLGNSYTDEAYPEENGSTDASQTTETETTTETESTQKLVYEANIRMETTEYAETVKAIKQLISDNNGLIENEYEQTDSSYYGENALYYNTLKVRIPSENYDSFLNGLSGKGNIISKQTSTKNITKTYYDTSATIDALKIQQERLLEMMSNAQTVEDMITIESRLTEVETALKQYQAQLSTMDTDVEYSTITIDIEEVAEYSENGEPIKTNTFLDRLKNTLEETVESVQVFFEGLLFIVIRLAPFVLIFSAIGIPIYKVCKKRKINKKNKNISEKKDGQNQ